MTFEKVTLSKWDDFSAEQRMTWAGKNYSVDLEAYMQGIPEVERRTMGHTHGGQSSHDNRGELARND